MATLPTKILEIEFDTGVWTNVTADLVTIGSRRGRNRESGAFETGTMTFSLRNDTRKYDPDNTAGTYYGKLRPNRRVRWRNTFNAVTYDCFVGYIDRIAQLGGGPNDATAEFSCSDFFKLLNRAELPRSAYAAEIPDDTPALWWSLGEAADATIATDNSGNGRDGVRVGALTLSSGLTVRDPDGATQFPLEASNTYIGPGNVTLSSASPFAIEFWYRPTANPVFYTHQILTVGDVSTGSQYLSIQRNAISGITTVLIAGAAGTFYQANLATNFVTGTTYHVVFTHAADRVMRVYVNGVLDVTGDTTAGTWSFTNLYLGAYYPSATPGAIIDELAVYTGTIPTAARIAEHNTIGRTPWNGDTPGTRLTRIFSEVATTGSYVLDTGEPTLQATSLGGTVLGYAQKVEETTLGALFVAKNGDVTFVGRNTLVTGTYLTSQATLVDDDSGAGIPYRRADADVDEARIVTRATVSRDGSSAVQVFDTAAKTEFGWLDETHDGLLHSADSYSRSYAEWIVNTHKTPSSRVGAVSLELTGNPAAMYPAILALEIGQRVTWKRKAQNQGSVLSIDMRVEAISHATGPGQYWTTTLQLSPFNIAGNPVGVWQTTLWDQSVWSI